MEEEEDFDKVYEDVQNLLSNLCEINDYNPLMVAGIFMATGKGIYKNLLSPTDYHNLMDNINKDIVSDTLNVTVH